MGNKAVSSRCTKCLIPKSPCEPFVCCWSCTMDLTLTNVLLNNSTYLMWLGSNIMTLTASMRDLTTLCFVDIDKVPYTLSHSTTIVRKNFWQQTTECLCNVNPVSLLYSITVAHHHDQAQCYTILQTSLPAELWGVYFEYSRETRQL